MSKKLFNNYTITAAGFCIWFIGWGTYTPCFSVFLKPLLTEFGWSRAAASVAYSLSFLVMAISAIIMGWLTDKFGPRLVIMVFGSFLGICYILMYGISNLWQFQLNYGVLAGIGASTLNVPVMVTLSRWFYKRRGLIIGVVQAGMGIGGMIFTPLAGWLVVQYGWRIAYLVLGIVTLTGIFIAGFFLKRDPEEIGQLPYGVDKNPLLEVKSINLQQEYGRFSLREALQSREFWIIAGLYFTFGFCRSAFTGHITAHVQDLGFGLIDGANVLAVIIGASLFGRVGMGRVADIIGNKPSFILSFAGTTISLMIGLIARDLWMLYLFALIFGVAWGNQAVLRFTLTSETFGPSSLGVLMGTLGFVESVAAMFGSYFAGYVFDVFGNYKLVFWTGIAISFGGTILAALLHPVGVKR